MTEAELMRRIQAGLCRDRDVRLWRNNAGVGWQGIERWQPDLSLLLLKPRRITFGLGAGSSDQIGFRSVVITPDMIGRRVAIFAGIEVKLPGRRATDAQRRFIEVVRSFGGLVGVASSFGEAQKVLTQPLPAEMLDSPHQKK